jgi:hypothetical protein
VNARRKFLWSLSFTSIALGCLTLFMAARGPAMSQLSLGHLYSRQRQRRCHWSRRSARMRLGPSAVMPTTRPWPVLAGRKPHTGWLWTYVRDDRPFAVSDRPQPNPRPFDRYVPA